MSEPLPLNLEPLRDKAELRKQLKAERASLADREARCERLQEMLRVWLVSRTEQSIGAYWPIKGEFDTLPALFRWTEGGEGRRIGLPVMNKETRQLTFHRWFPGCPMEEDAYGIPKPKGTPSFHPDLLIVPCVGFGPGGLRLGYGGGFYDCTLAALTPRPVTLGIGFAHGFVPWLRREAHDIPLDALLTEEGRVWP